MFPYCPFLLRCGYRFETVESGECEVSACRATSGDAQCFFLANFCHFHHLRMRHVAMLREGCAPKSAGFSHGRHSKHETKRGVQAGDAERWLAGSSLTIISRAHRQPDECSAMMHGAAKL